MEMNDLKFLFRNIDFEQKQKTTDPIFSSAECTHTYSMIKEIALIDQNIFGGNKLDTMVETGLRTL